MSSYGDGATKLAKQAKQDNDKLWEWYQALERRADELKWAQDKLCKPKGFWDDICPICRHKLGSTGFIHGRGLRYYWCPNPNCDYEYAKD